MNSLAKQSIYAVYPETWKAILWRDQQRMLKTGKILLSLITTFFFLLPIDHSGFMIVASSLLLAIYLSYALGCSDLIEMRESYAFTLPFRRADYFWSRLLAGLAILLSAIILMTTVTFFDLSSKFWSWFFQSGLATPSTIDEKELGDMLIIAIFAGTSLYLTNFALNSMITNIKQFSAMLSLALAIVFLPSVFLLTLLESANGYQELEFTDVAVFLMPATTALLLFQSLRIYLGKTPIS